MDFYRVEPGIDVDLNQWDPNDKRAFDGKKRDGKAHLIELNAELAELQRMFFAQNKHRLLVILQAMDAGGKDGTVRNVFRAVNPQGVQVISFKKPTRREFARDFLWRIHREVPGTGEIVVFNRSHYEDVLVVRLYDLVPPEIWSKRYDHINNFERMLVDEGTTILKFYLHISPDEQKERLQARLDEPHKRWKFNPDDLEHRRNWDGFMHTYEIMLSRTSTPWAPWYIIPANRKWYRNIIVSQTIIDTMKQMDLAYPEPNIDPSDYIIE